MEPQQFALQDNSTKPFHLTKKERLVSGVGNLFTFSLNSTKFFVVVDKDEIALLDSSATLIVLVPGSNPPSFMSVSLYA